MARPKSPQKLLEEALAKGDLEAAKAALAKTKEKPKKKAKPKATKAKVVKPTKTKKTKILEKEYETDEDGAVLLVKPSKKESLSEFRTKRKDEDSEDRRQSIPQRLIAGQTINKFDPKKFITPFSEALIKEDKKAIKKWNPSEKDQRDGLDISEVKVTCSTCSRRFSMENWELQAKRSIDDEEVELFCNRCLKERKQ